ncbi:MAG: exopolyphosphatase [Thermobacillus sp. ZCTH02-B1]|uniref:DHH family phosphoesterase n=1 Tax=Thermobacillus sp. ZCTH02-B1 TaxID=1858795 RepID=UPI000B55910E|nr:bifunctional oligoribonuclease/PAP phosphatase NrnA [Thermobacillus sp. ZCTH02-B1]OUM96936.1 MAG: exopolyphosphatase [Thermobacillus sp. ZCTH02-B1]
MAAAGDPYVARLDEALRFLREHDDFLIVSHVQPDGDAISSTIAVRWLLDRLGKRSLMINEGRVPPRLAFLPYAGEIVNYGGRKPERRFRAVVAVDCADFSRIGLVSELFDEPCALLNIDHHPTNDAFGTVNLLRHDAAATAEILFDLIEHAGLAIDAEAATVIYTGLLTDTGGFRYSNTSPHVMAAASKLLAAGADAHRLADRLLERMTVSQLRILQRGLARLEFTEDGRVGWLYIEPKDLEETGASGEDLEGLVNYARNIDGVEVGLLFKGMEDGTVKVSFRSAGKADVAAIAQRFGGGGHIRAAGCRLAMPLDEAMRLVVDTVRRALDSMP